MKEGDRVLAFASYSYELCIFMLSTMILGASIMYVDIWAKNDRLKTAFEEYKPEFVVVSKKTKMLKMFFKEINKIDKVLYVDRLPEIEGFKTKPKEVSNDLEALLTMTTGSTGTPKIAIRTHKHLYEQLILVEKNLDKSLDSEYVLTTSYMYVFVNILKGFTTVLPRINLGKMSPKKLDKRLGVFKDIPVTMIITSPDFCLKTTNVYKDLKKIYIGGAILNLYESDIISHKFKTADIRYIYGSTECNLITITNLEDYRDRLKNKHQSVLGEVVEGAKVKIGPENEIYVTSNALLETYLNSESTQNKVIDDENTTWHNTGDTGEYKNNVLIYFGRSDRYLEHENKKIYYSQIEQALSANFRTIEKVAILTNNNQVIVFIEKEKDVHVDHEEIKVFIKTSFKLEKVMVKNIKKIPCDVKHNTKIDYRELEKYV